MLELQTARLVLRPMALDDLDWFAALRGDAEVMRYIGAGAPLTREQAKERLDRLVSCWTNHGLGIFSVRLREEPVPVGWAGLQPLEDGKEIEVGYGFGRPAWGRGIATEAAQAVVQWGFTDRALDRIVAVAYPENEGSRRVMDKLGMRHEGMRLAYGSESVYYSLLRADHKPGTPPRATGG